MIAHLSPDRTNLATQVITKGDSNVDIEFDDVEEDVEFDNDDEVVKA